MLSEEQWFAFAMFAVFSTSFTADAVWNWGLFRSRPRSGSGRENYGPIERLLRLFLGLSMLIILLGVSSILVSNWLRPPAPELPSPRSAERPRASSPEAVPPAAATPSEAKDDDFHFWFYEDDAGLTHMVDGLEKVPPAYRARAREKR